MEKPLILQPEVPMNPVMVMTTCNNREAAEKIATQLLTRRLAACIHISSPVQSMYWWDNTIESDDEVVISIKSTKELFNRIMELIKKYHDYDIPEIIAIDIVAVEPRYLDWMKSTLAED